MTSEQPYARNALFQFFFLSIVSMDSLSQEIKRAHPVRPRSFGIVDGQTLEINTPHRGWCRAKQYVRNKVADCAFLKSISL